MPRLIDITQMIDSVDNLNEIIFQVVITRKQLLQTLGQILERDASLPHRLSADDLAGLMQKALNWLEYDDQAQEDLRDAVEEWRAEKESGIEQSLMDRHAALSVSTAWKAAAALFKAGYLSLDSAPPALAAALLANPNLTPTEIAALISDTSACPPIILAAAASEMAPYELSPYDGTYAED